MSGKALVLWTLVVVTITEVISARVPRQATKCEDVDVPQAANRVLYYDKTRNLLNIQFACFKGYTLMGSFKIVCKDGKWSANAPICIKATDGNMFDYPPKSDQGTEACLDPGLPPTSSRTAFFTRNKLEFGSRLKYFCTNGYNLEGKGDIFCKKNGQWSGPVPFCNSRGMSFSPTSQAQPVVHEPPVFSKPPTTCREVHSIRNGVRTPDVNIEKGFKYMVDAQISFACNDNFYLVGAAKITCSVNGKWDGDVPKCIASKISTDGYCNKPPTPVNGDLAYIFPKLDLIRTDHFLKNTIVEYVCNDLYTLKKHETGQRACLSTGNWGGSEYKCEIDCGKVRFSPHKKSLVLNGEISKHGAWPWQIAVEVNFEKLQMSNLLGKHDGTYTSIPLFHGWGITCGGALISKRWVLTAAHCLKNRTNGKLHPEEAVKVYAGKHYRANTRDDLSIVQSRMASVIYTHNKYSSATDEADIALILVEKPFEINERVLPACLPSYHSDWQTSEVGGVIAGWGLTAESEPSNELRQAAMKWAPPAVCEKRCPRTSSTSHSGIIDGMFCAIPRVEASGGQAYLGDSGSPLVFPVGSGKDLHWVVEGLVSWDYVNCKASTTVFTEVRHYLGWIYTYVPHQT